MPRSFEQFETDLAASQAAVHAEGWTGRAAQFLMINGANHADFAAGMANAREIRAIAKIARPQCEAAGFMDTDVAVEHAIVNQIPLAKVRASIVDLLAQYDSDTHVDTARNITPATGDVYAQRKAEAVNHGRR